MGKKVMIVFEETDEHTIEGTKFNVYLDGMDIKAADKMTPDQRREKLSTAEFYAHHFFQGVVLTLVKLGIVRDIRKRT